MTATAVVTGVTPGCSGVPDGGTVEFYVDGKLVGSGTVAGPVELRFDAPGAGEHEIVARFLGVEMLGANDSEPAVLEVFQASPGGLPVTGFDATILLPSGMLLLGGVAIVVRAHRRESS